PWATCCRHHCAFNWRFQGAKLAKIALELFHNPMLCPFRHIMPIVIQLFLVNNVHRNVWHSVPGARPVGFWARGWKYC
ncbi:hypothetical protein PILCRDRAFT_78580, partial [Piloderma croceum F 1598]